MQSVVKSAKQAFGGLAGSIYYAKKSWITQHPVLDLDPSTQDEERFVTGPFTMATDKKFEKIDVIIFKGATTLESLGDPTVSSAFGNKLEFEIINNTPDAFSFITGAHKPDSDFVFLIPNLDDNLHQVFGYEKFPALCTKISGGGGMKPEDGKAVKFEFMCTGPLARFYDTTLTTPVSQAVVGINA
jgi:hypothetical protein